ncbi:hypothetical protein ENSA5_43750 [Enhygromyxa salina]|uniref:Uncharacterized protein n=1 Tax=Enhygromyxa salina TaxID=215803 RepID=A0A2S9XKL7_9BACT|nr:hypothetical protein [Enhygromyxa salina]PRP93280.1 hypothetical protein ENSA5_43750 [Enhygromyxa salina]
MSTETHPSLAERYALTPGVGVGRICFGDRVTEHHDLILRDPEPEHAGVEDYAEYGVAELEETLILYVDAEGRVDSASFYEFCLVEGHDLIGMGVGELLVVLGVPSAIEAEEIGREVELLYAYDALGLTIWTVEGEVCVVQAGRPSAG